MLEHTNAKDMLVRYRTGDVTPQERELIERWWLMYGVGDDFDLSEADERRIADQMRRYMEQEILARTDSDLEDSLLLDTRPVSRRRKGVYAGVAAAMLLLMVVAGWPFGRWKHSTTLDKQYAETIVPGSNRATLTLDDGTKVNLNEAQSGIVIGDQITYNDGSALSDYLPIAKLLAPAQRPLQLMLSTPRGGHYQITLSDGTVVWLNAASILRYPMRFEEGRRVVELEEGEAYFDVKSVADQPFIVRTPNQDIEVLGTEFNVMAYAEEPASRTTLVSGALRVSMRPGGGEADASDPAASVILMPGQQATLQHNHLHTKAADVESEVAWKKGYFTFENEDIQSIMRKAARWYDHLDVEYEGELPKRRFNGGIPREATLQEFLQVLELNNIKFKQIGNKIIINQNL